MRRRESDASRFRFRLQGLLADAELFLGDDGTVAGDVLLDQVIKQATALTYESLKGAGGSIIFVI